jgi:hypothetical protein
VVKKYQPPPLLARYLLAPRAGLVQEGPENGGDPDLESGLFLVLRFRAGDEAVPAPFVNQPGYCGVCLSWSVIVAVFCSEVSDWVPERLSLAISSAPSCNGYVNTPPAPLPVLEKMPAVQQ